MRPVELPPGRPTAKARGGARPPTGYLRNRKRPADHEVYAAFLRRLHDSETVLHGPARGIITRSHSGIVGEFQSTKAGRSLPYESQNERRAFVIREADPSVRIFHAQPLSMTLDGRRYTADILTEYWDGRTVLEEVKPKAKLDRPEVQERHLLAREQARQRGWEFEKVTAEELARQPRLRNSELLSRYQRHRVAPEAVEAARDLVSLGAACTLSMLEEELRPMRVGLEELLAMVARGAFNADLEGRPLSPETRVWPAAHVRRFFL